MPNVSVQQDERFLPTRIVGSLRDGTEQHVGDFEFGVVLQGMTLLDVKTRNPIANMARRGPRDNPIFVWEVPKLNRTFYYLFMQTMPSDAPVEVNIDGRRQMLY